MIIELDLNNIDQFDLNILSKEEIIKEFKSNPFSKYLIYVEKDKILGYIYYSNIYERAEINQIEVDFIRRNCGIGTKMMQKLTETVEKSITLEVKEDNYAAKKLYEKFNFEEKAIRRGYYQGIDGILMERVETKE